MNLSVFLSKFNWLDYLLLVFFIYGLVDGWNVGFIKIASGLFTYVLSILLSIRYHQYVGNKISRFLNLSAEWNNVIGYIVSVILIQVVLSVIYSVLIDKHIRKLLNLKLDSFLGLIAGFLNSLLITSFILLVLLNMPFSKQITTMIKNSQIASNMISFLQNNFGDVTDTIDEISKHTIQFLTVNPESKDIINLDFQIEADKLHIDQESEIKMLNLVNAERIKNGVVPLVSDGSLQGIARAHSSDMLINGYFSHSDKKGKMVSDRMIKSGITSNLIGENLAYAKDVNSAMSGLKSSQSHYQNIKDPSFLRIGIGIIDAGMYGKMFTQIYSGDIELIKAK